MQNHRFPVTFPQTKNQLSRADSRPAEITRYFDDSAPNPIGIERFQRIVIERVSKSRLSDRWLNLEQTMYPNPGFGKSD